MANIAVVLHGPNDLRVESIPVPEIKDNEVLLAMCSVGICGSDLKYWKYGKCGKFSLEKPMIMGHEGSGKVVKVGSGVKHLKIGDRVAIEPGVSCGVCRLCKTGRYNLCPRIFFCATPPDDGNLCRLYKHSAQFCFRLPDHVTDDEGAMLEPLAVAVYSCRKGKVGLGTKLLICGAGPVGILTLMVAKQNGATTVVITDIDETRLALAKSLGADFTIRVSSEKPEQLATNISEILGDHPDVTIECSGTNFGFSTGIYATLPGGCLVMVGRVPGDAEFPLNLAFTKEIDITGVFRYANCYPTALELVSKGVVDVKPLISHRFSLPDSVKAFETASSHDTKAVKVIIECGQN
ncbi:sorbitol dehydrogenase isoform X1 [Magallana gigas]|uniref:sorbitol dehydrogenase isoform X1 n=2 Tax=Magallana gigas TaxID=29159 RepID=UPI0005C39955|eukprot:XP_011418885.1 PREDICTED: sorbitol dehydrogenase-like isoform X1 [Crassostrea gigas]